MFADKLKSLRKAKDIKQTDLANVLGISQSTYAKYEINGYPEFSTLIKIADFFGVSLDYLLDRDNTQRTYNYDDIANLTELANEIKSKIIAINEKPGLNSDIIQDLIKQKQDEIHEELRLDLLKISPDDMIRILSLLMIPDNKESDTL